VKGRPISYPISYQYWKKRTTGRGSGIGFDTPYLEVTKDKITFASWIAEPVDRKDSTSAWLTGRRKAVAAARTIIGASAYKARIGTYTGGANGVFWLEIMAERPGGQLMVANATEEAKKKVSPTQAAVEAELVFPLLRGANVTRWSAKPSLSILITHEPTMRLNAIPVSRMQRDFPKAYSYLARFKDFLLKRAAFKRYFKEDAPFYSLFDIGEYTFAPWKVVWREQADELTAAVLGPQDRRPVIPDHKIMMVACGSRSEAHFLCAALNSAPSRFVVAAYTIQTQMDTHILENVAVPRFSKSDRTHSRLVELSEAAHEATAKGQTAEVERIEAEIDRAAARLWGLSDEDLNEIKRSLEEA
jgi:hypothetical protein